MEVFRHEELHMQNPPPEKNKSGIVVCIVALILAAVSFVLSVTAAVIALTRDGGKKEPLGYGEIFDSVKSSVAEVYCSSEVGSGVVYRTDDEFVYMITNHHVIINYATEGANTSVRFSEFGDKIDGEVLGYDEYHDIALVRIEKSNISGAEVKAATIGDRPATGAGVLAVGNNLGYGIAAFEGIVSKADRMLKYGNEKRVPVIAVTCPINGGMSGGGLFDEDGKLVGINTYQTTATNGTTVYGMGYCVPISVVEKLADMIYAEKSGEQVDKITVTGNVYIEDQIDFESMLMSATFTSEGLKVTALGYDENDPPAYIDGRVQLGDIVTAIGGMKINADTDFTAVFSECLNYTYKSGGERLKVTYERDGKAVTVTYTKLYRGNFAERAL